MASYEAMPLGFETTVRLCTCTDEGGLVAVSSGRCMYCGKLFDA